MWQIFNLRVYMLLQEKILHTLKTSFGNAIEWYDFCLFGYFASTIGKVFFHSQSSFSSLLLAFATFAVGFLARPLGGFVFGWIGDRIGRHYSMNLAIIMMGISTLSVAVLPGYQTIGIMAPILLVLIRIMQGLSAGGQFASLIVVTTEDKKLDNKGFYSGVALTVSVLGFLLASGISYLVVNFSPPEYLTYAWRMTFAIGGVLLAIYFFLVRSEIQKEFTSFEPDTTKANKNTFQLLWQDHKARFVISTLLAAVLCVIFYLDFVYLITFFTTYDGLSLNQSLIINSVVLAVACILYPFCGLLSDKYGRANVTIVGLVLHLLLLYPMFQLLLSHNIAHIYLGTLMMTVLLCVIQSAATPIFSEIFPKSVRSSGCCASYGLGAAISGFAPMLATQLTHYNVHSLMYIFLVTLVVGIACVVPLTIKSDKLQLVQQQPA